MFDNLSSEYFNFFEGVFWFLLGLVCITLFFKTSKPYKSLALFSALVLITFGISDFFQVIYGSFLVLGMEWLFVWKIVDVLGLVLIFLWYLKLRLKK